MPRVRLVAVGRVGRPHGLKGEVRLDSGGELAQGLKHYSRFYLGRASGAAVEAAEVQPVEIEACRPHGKLLLVKLSGFDSADAVSGLVHSLLYVERAEMPPLDPEEYYHADLLGCRVLDEAGAELGRVSEVLATGAHDLLVIESKAGEWMLPVVGECVLSMDLEAGELRVRVPEGLRD